jgi:3-oxoacyl-[acyl-carrier protein] reductase
MKLLENRTIVTGAARGIGEAIALKFAEHGAHVAFTMSDSSAERSSLLEEKLKSFGVKAKAYKEYVDFSVRKIRPM